MGPREGVVPDLGLRLDLYGRLAGPEDDWFRSNLLLGAD